jgi:hypothetical protein
VGWEKSLLLGILLQSYDLAQHAVKALARASSRLGLLRKKSLSLQRGLQSSSNISRVIVNEACDVGSWQRVTCITRFLPLCS